MFVIMECWHNLARDPAISALSIPERMGRTMKHAGVSVTVTSITDVFAFGIGACTVSDISIKKTGAPLFFVLDNARFESFLCERCHLHCIDILPTSEPAERIIGFIMTFTFSSQVSWFIAWVTLDQQRIQQKKHGIFPCKTIKETDEIPLENIPFVKKVMNNYSKFFDYWPFKVNLFL